MVVAIQFGNLSINKGRPEMWRMKFYNGTKDICLLYVTLKRNEILTEGKEESFLFTDLHTVGEEIKVFDLFFVYFSQNEWILGSRIKLKHSRNTTNKHPIKCSNETP